MRILIDILHPAHVHFFKHFHAEMRAKGHELCITARAKDRSTDLLERYHLPYQLISRQQTGIRLAAELVRRTGRLSGVVRRFRPDVLTGIMGPSIALCGRLHRLPAVVFYDTEFAIQTNWFTYPLAHSVCTPDCYQRRVRGQHVTYPGYHELAYLHPSRFQPDPAKLAAFGLTLDRPYTLVRFVSWQAAHDRQERGLSADHKRALLHALRRHGQVVLSSEADLPPDLDRYRLTGPVEDIHHVIAFAELLAGESATMCSEAAVLGVPSLFLATTGRGYTDDQERRYGLVRHFTDGRFNQAMDTIGRLFQSGSPRRSALDGRARLLRDKIDVTGWMVAFFERTFSPAAMGSP